MKPEQVVEARELIHMLDRIDRDIEKLSKVMMVGDCSVSIRLDSGVANDFRLTSCDLTKEGMNITSVMRDIFLSQKESVLHRLKALGVEV